MDGGVVQLDAVLNPRVECLHGFWRGVNVSVGVGQQITLFSVDCTIDDSIANGFGDGELGSFERVEMELLLDMGKRDASVGQADFPETCLDHAHAETRNENEGVVAFEGLLVIIDYLLEVGQIANMDGLCELAVGFESVGERGPAEYPLLGDLSEQELDKTRPLLHGDPEAECAGLWGLGQRGEQQLISFAIVQLDAEHACLIVEIASGLIRRHTGLVELGVVEQVVSLIVLLGLEILSKQGIQDGQLGLLVVAQTGRTMRLQQGVADFLGAASQLEDASVVEERLADEGAKTAVAMHLDELGKQCGHRDRLVDFLAVDETDEHHEHQIQLDLLAHIVVARR